VQGKEPIACVSIDQGYGNKKKRSKGTRAGSGATSVGTARGGVGRGEGSNGGESLARERGDKEERGG